ncbi:MAG: Asp23/Gls24 family envelope stress response protein [Bacillota bacterium]|jgi:uncharacterized alkaline shock family protein YloU
MEDKVLEVEVKSEEAENTIKIANDVVATIAGIAASEIDGVVGMSGGIVEGIGQMLGRKQLTKGVKVEINDDVAFIDISIIVEYGSKIPEVAKNIQENVKESVVTMTGLEIGAVNVHVQGVAFPQPEEKKEEAEVETEE